VSLKLECYFKTQFLYSEGGQNMSSEDVKTCLQGCSHVNVSFIVLIKCCNR